MLAVLFTTRGTLGGETSDDPWRTFRPLAFRPFHDLFMKKRQSTRCGQRSTNQPRGQRRPPPVRGNAQQCTCDSLCKRYAWDRCINARCLSGCVSPGKRSMRNAWNEWSLTYLFCEENKWRIPFVSRRERETILINCDNRVEGRNFGANLTK